MIQLINSSTIDAGSIEVTIPPYDPGTQGEDFQAVGVGTYNVSAGAYSVEVYNAGLNNITVNGDTVPPNEYARFSAISNPVTQRMDFCPAVTVIVSASGQATIKTVTPSA